MVGRTPPICDSSSAFNEGYATCVSCLDANGDGTKDFKTFISSKFQEWVDFCMGEAPQLMTTRTYQSTLVISDINGRQATSIVRTYTTIYAPALESTSTTTRSNSVSSVPLSNLTMSSTTSSTLPTETSACSLPTLLTFKTDHLQKQIPQLQGTKPGLLALSWAPFARSFCCPSDGGSYDGVSGITLFYRQQTIRRRGLKRPNSTLKMPPKSLRLN